MSRAVETWIGQNDDSAIPPRVRVRLFQRADGKCQVCTRKIRPGEAWACDHVVALVNGGSHSESNMQVICEWCHKKKTAVDVAIKRKTAAMRAKHVGVKKRSSFPASRDSRWKKKINGEVVER